MLLYRLTNVSLAYGDQALLDSTDLTIHKGQRIGILGQNGAGKSTFMKLLSGSIHPDSGELWRAPDIRAAYLDQNLPVQSEETVYDYVAGGLSGLGELLRRYHALTHQGDFSEPQLNEMAQVQKQIEAQDGWSAQHRIDSIIGTLKLPEESLMKELSGGGRRRAALARALLSEPDVLLLDEPTNHLDIPTIEWLEKHLNGFGGAILVVSHDRTFLKKITNRIIEVDRGKLRCWDYDYESFLRFRDQQLEAEEKANSEFDKRLAEEEKWIRQGIKARRTRNEGRVRALEKMREQRAQRREMSGKAKFGVEQAGSSGKIVVEAEHISHGYDGKTLINDFSTKIMRGDKVGFIGANGSGKSTLLKILLGEIEADAGEVKRGTKLEIIYFDQLREQLDLEKSVIDNLAEGREFIEINGKTKHVISYLQEFLFLPRRARQPVRSLSGGEQNRLILAKLFSKPANVIVLDEPTNDLDMETLELLEEILLSFTGTLLLVSHDRNFLDNVITSCIVFEGNGKVREYVGGYQDWVNKGGRLTSFSDRTANDSDAPTTNGGSGKSPDSPASRTSSPASFQSEKAQPGKSTGNRDRKLSYKLQRELDQLPKSIEQTETRIQQLESEMAEAGFFSQSQEIVDRKVEELASAQDELEKLFVRWEELENQ